MNREQLEEMTKAELQEHAEVQGIKVLVLDTKGTMIDKILGEYKEPEKTVAKKDSGALPPEKGFYDLQGNKIIPKMWNLTIMSTENDSSDVDIVVNGYNIRVQRNVEVQVAEQFIEALKNSTIQTNVQDPDTGKMIPRSIMIYPHQASPVL
jgi:hypothetical protein